MDNLDFKIKGIGAVISDGKLRVAAHQRDYYWDSEKAVDLFDDFKTAVDKGKSHFLGTIVLRSSKDGFDIVDGQQRLATTSMLLAAIRDTFFSRKDSVMTKSVEDDFLFRRDRNSEEIVPMLRLNTKDHVLFARKILAAPDSQERKGSVAVSGISNSKLLSAAKTIRAKLDDTMRATPEATQKATLKRWLDFIELEATLMVLTVPSSENAYVLFETLNDRGIRVSEADLVKNYIFGKAIDGDNQQRLDQVTAKWGAAVTLIESLGTKEDVIDYLRILCSVKYGLIRERDVFKEIKANVTTGIASVDFVHELEEFATDYVAMLSPDHPKWNDYPPSIRKSLRTLAMFDIMQIRYLMLAVAHHFKEQEAAKAFHLFVNWIVRFFIAGADKIGRVDNTYARLAHTIHTTREITTAAELAGRMSPYLATDDEFKQAFAVARVSQAKLARYYLDSLERKVTDGEDAGLVPDDDTSKVNLEHIVPLNPDGDWGELDAETVTSLYNRLGNMVLLNAKRNSKIGNVGFGEKKEVFSLSPFLLTKRVAAHAKWGIEEVDHRQAELAEIAVKTWPTNLK